MNQLPVREAIEEKDKWAIEDLYVNDKQWEKDYTFVKENMEKLSDYQGKLDENADNLLAYLKLNDELSMILDKIYVYSHQRYHENTQNAVYQSMSSKASNLLVQFDSNTSFFMPEILAIPDEKLEQFYKELKELLVYKRFIDILKRKCDHILSEDMEHLLALAGEMSDTSSNVFSMFNNADVEFPAIIGEDNKEIKITHGRFITLLQSKNREVRRDAFVGLYHTYQQYKNTLATLFSSNIKKNIFYKEARHYNSCLEMELDDSNIPNSVYFNLIEAVHSNLDSMYEYMKVRKEALNLDELYMYDLYTPIVDDVDKKISFEEAKELVINALQPLGEEYITILKEGFDNRWIDVYENQGKRSGAYSWGAYSVHPYVLLNHQNNLNSVFTLAHEMGHAIHSYYSNQTQPFVYAGYKIFVAEVASTVNEALLMHYLIRTWEGVKEKKYLINYHLEQFRTTLFRQTMFAEFEYLTHDLEEKGDSLTADELCKLYHDLNEKYYGSEVKVEHHIDMEWARIPHFYTPFYVYQYATGYSAATAISQGIMNGDEKVIEGYKEFLKGGGSKDPIDLLKLCQVDMTTKKPVNDALKVFRDLIEEFKKLG